MKLAWLGQQLGGTGLGSGRWACLGTRRSNRHPGQQSVAEGVNGALRYAFLEAPAESRSFDVDGYSVRSIRDHRTCFTRRRGRRCRRQRRCIERRDAFLA